MLQDGLRDDAIQHEGARRCIHPSYYYHVKYFNSYYYIWIDIQIQKEISIYD